MCLPFDYDMGVISSVMNPSNLIFSAEDIYWFFFCGAGEGRFTDEWKVGGRFFSQVFRWWALNGLIAGKIER